jgi:hypothetical protein
MYMRLVKNYNKMNFFNEEYCHNINRYFLKCIHIVFIVFKIHKIIISRIYFEFKL